MRSILKALGLTIWGLIAIALLAMFVFVGYEAAIRHRAASDALVDESTSSDRSERGQLGPSGGMASSSPTSRTSDILRASVPPPPRLR